MIDNVRGKTLPLEWLEQIGETPDQIFQIIIKVKSNVEQDNHFGDKQTTRTKKTILPHVPKEIRNRVLKSLMEESDDNNDDLNIEEIKTSRSSKDSDSYNFFD